jgi:hypothetical protein
MKAMMNNIVIETLNVLYKDDYIIDERWKTRATSGPLDDFICSEGYATMSSDISSHITYYKITLKGLWYKFLNDKQLLTL